MAHHRPERSMAQSLGGARVQSDASWVEISSQPSSSSLSSAAEDAHFATMAEERSRRGRRALQHLTRSARLRAESAQGTSSQEEYDESESESDPVMTSSGEGPQLPLISHRASNLRSAVGNNLEVDDDENKTAVNYPISNGNVFTPQPNAFTHPPATRSASQPVPGSYFPTVSRVRPAEALRQRSETQPHLPRNVLAPSYAHHDEALRNSLSTLLSCAAAARGLKDPKPSQPQRSNRIEPMTLRLVPESALPASPPVFDIQAPVFKPTLRRHSTTTTSTSPDRAREKAKRAASRERRVVKKARRSSVDELSPTFLTWVVSAGVVVVLSAISFSAGYSMGREAGRMESVPGANCAREAGRGLGLKRSLARSAVQV